MAISKADGLMQRPGGRQAPMSLALSPTLSQWTPWPTADTDLAHLTTMTTTDADADPAQQAERAERAERAALEISLGSALELCRLGLATMVDIRQLFEIEIKGAIPGTVNIPLFEVKVMLGHPLTADEQEALDCGKPADIDARSFFTTLNQLHHVREHILLIICNSGRRSLYAARLLRDMGYGKALSVGGGFQAWKQRPVE